MTKSNFHEKLQSAIFALSAMRDEADDIHSAYFSELTKWRNENDENIAGDKPEDPDADSVSDFIKDALNNLEDALALARTWKDTK